MLWWFGIGGSVVFLTNNNTKAYPYSALLGVLAISLGDIWHMSAHTERANIVKLGFKEFRIIAKLSLSPDQLAELALL